MLRLALMAIGVVLACGAGASEAVDHRFEQSILRPLNSSLSYSPAPASLASVGADVTPLSPAVSSEFASVMIWYRAAFAEGLQPAMVSTPWPTDDRAPDPSRFVWIAESGDVVARAGRGQFRLAFADGRSNWYREVTCSMVSWPDGDAKAALNCSDGIQRTMYVPEQGTVEVDDTTYLRLVKDGDWPVEPAMTGDETPGDAGDDATGALPEETAEPDPAQ